MYLVTIWICYVIKWMLQFQELKGAGQHVRLTVQYKPEEYNRYDEGRRNNDKTYCCRDTFNDIGT